ncbi:MAG: CBS domain-containing protein [Conexivisphaera sp.]
MSALDAIRNVKVADLMRKDFESIRIDEPLSKAMGKLEDAGVLVVLDANGNYAGVLTERDAIRTLLDPTTTKVGSVYRKAPRASPDDDALRAARLMMENDLRYLPVSSGDVVVGIVGSDAIMEEAIKTRFGGTKVSDVMTSNPVSISEDDTVAKALATMRKEGISRLPVLRGDRVVGILTIRDVIEKVLRPRAGITEGGPGPLRRRVADIMSRDVASVLPEDQLRRAVRTMLDRDVASVVVTDGGGRLRGLLTRSDVLRSIVRAAQEGSQVVVQFSVKDPEEFENVELDREKLGAMIDGFLRKYSKFLGPAHVTVYLKRHRERKRGRRLTHCRIRIDGPKGMFVGIGEGWGLSQAVRNALDNVSRQVERVKEGREEDRALVEEILEML